MERTTFMDLVEEVIAEELAIIEEVIKEEIEPIIKQREEMTKRAFNKEYADLKKLEAEVGG